MNGLMKEEINMSHPKGSLQALCEAINAVKRTALRGDTIDVSQYLGGDLAIDSIEMLEIWFRVEKILAFQIPDDAKRDIYTVHEVVQVIERHLPALTMAEAFNV